MAQTVNREELRQEIEEGSVVVLEALPPEYYDKEHLPGAQNLPLDDLDQRVTRLVPDKDQAIITYCSNDACENSTIAAARLRDLGYSNVRKYPGGKQDWIEAGLAVEADITD
jgi:rhodanese-related sulfurtransferase